MDIGANHLQNSPEFVVEQTSFNEVTGNLEVRYRVDTNEGDASYPLEVDFYLGEVAGQVETYVGSDSYPASSATLFRSVAITPPVGVEVAGMLVATATDADGNTSELSRQMVPVPEPAGTWLLGAGVASLSALARWRRRRIAHAAQS